MLVIEIEYKNNKYSRIKLIGHTNYEEKGKDIVCSSASSIVITTVNAILKFDKNYLNLEKQQDLLLIKINNNDQISDKLIMNMIDMLKELSINYPKNIMIKEEKL